MCEQERVLLLTSMTSDLKIYIYRISIPLIHKYICIVLRRQLIYDVVDQHRDMIGWIGYLAQ
jgi:hypothetical protein